MLSQRLKGASLSTFEEAIVLGSDFNQLYAYALRGTTFAQNIVTPSVAGLGNIQGACFSPARDSLVIFHASSPFVSGYPFSEVGFGTKFSDPSTLVNSVPRDAHFLGGGSHVLFCDGGTTPRIHAYAWSGTTGFGAKVADPSTIPAGGAWRITSKEVFTSRVRVGVSHDNSPFLTVYEWTGAFGAKISDPSTLAAGNGAGLAFNPVDQVITLGHSNTPFVRSWNFGSSGTFGSAIGNPGTLPAGRVEDVAFSKTGQLSLCHANSPFISVYAAVSGSGYGAKYANPATLPSTTCLSSVFNDDVTALFATFAAASGNGLIGWEFNATTGFGAAISLPTTSVISPQVNKISYWKKP